MSVQTWADSAYKSKNRHEGDEVVIALFITLLEDKSTSEATALEISALYEPKIRAGVSDTHIPAPWGIFCDAARALGSDPVLATRLADLLIAIQDLPTVTDEYGNPIRTWDGYYWKDLPAFGMIFREYGVDIEVEPDRHDHHPGRDESTWPSEAVPLLNATSFAATHLARAFDNSLMAWFASSGLEIGAGAPCRTDDQRYSAVVYLPAAAVWIMIAGERIYQFCKDGFKEFSMERWDVWKKSLEENQNIEDLQHDLQVMSRRAADEMKRIEGSV